MEQVMVHEQQPAAAEASPYVNLIQQGDNPDITKVLLYYFTEIWTIN